MLREEKKQNNNKKNMLSKTCSGKIGHKQSVYGEPIWPQAGKTERIALCWYFLNTGSSEPLGNSVAHRASKPPETHSNQRWEGSVWAKRLGRPHVYDSLALNSGDSREPKGSLSWSQLFNSISWHKQQSPSEAPPCNIKDKACCINSAMGQTSQQAIIPFITFSIPKLILPWV